MLKSGEKKNNKKIFNKKNNCTDCSLCFRKAVSTERRIDLRPYGIGLLTNQVPSISMMLFILLLTTTIFIMQ